MTDHSERDDKLESLWNRTLRQLPPQAAPATLESRVVAELRRRASLPRWRSGFAYWPMLTRSAFVGASLVAMMLTVWSGASVIEGSSSLNDLGMFATSWAHPAMAALQSARLLAALFSGMIPTTWLYAGLAIGATFYVFLFGLGAAAYRTLYLQPFNGR